MTLDLLRDATRGLRALVTGRLHFLSDEIPYDLRLPRRKILNAALTQAAVVLKPEKPWGWPTHFMVEPSTHCNLQCVLCPVTKGLNRPVGHMDLELFRTIVDELADHAFFCHLWDWGEPFLNPAIYDMIAYAKSRGITLVSSTNGHVFADARHADRLVSSGLDTIIFAIDGITQSTYERYRQGGSLETALAGVRAVVASKRERRTLHPLVNLRFIVMRHNEHEVPQLVETARSLGVDALTLKTLNPGSQDPYSKVEKDLHDDMVPRSARYHRFRDPGAGEDRPRRRHNPCRQLWNHPSFHWDGTVFRCTYDTEGRYELGDMRRQTFASIWRGRPYRDLRSRFRKSWREVEMCGFCSYAFEGGACSTEIVAEAIFFDHTTPGSPIVVPG